MSRRLFFSFHYERDAWRAGQVRNSDLIPNEDELGFVDAVEWESIQRQGDEAVKRWIQGQLKSTSVTVVLIGAETAERFWVRYEIAESWNRGNGIVGLWIHNMKDQNGNPDVQGHNPLDDFMLPDGTKLSAICKTFDWVTDDGRNNLGFWVEQAFQDRAKYGADALVKVPTKSDAVRSPEIAVSERAKGGFTPRAPWAHLG